MLVDWMIGHSKESTKSHAMANIYILKIESTKLLLVDSLKSIELQHYEEIITCIN